MRIEIGLKPGVVDARGRSVAAKARQVLHLPVKECRTRDVFKVAVTASPEAAESIRRAFADPVIALPALGRLPPPARYDWLVEVAFKPGVTDNVGRTAQGVAQDVLDRPLRDGEGVFTSTQYFLSGKGLTRRHAESMALNLLANALIQDVRVFSPAEWAGAPVDDVPPVVRGAAEAHVGVFDLAGSDASLLQISRDFTLALSLAEMRAIRDYFRRPDIQAARAALGLPVAPTDVEVECLAQTWSEHCKHKIFAARVQYEDTTTGKREVIDNLFKTYIKAATEKIGREIDWLVSVFTDNAGIIRFDDRINISYKVETHNSPSALDPYGGAITGIVGVNRDPMGTGMGCEMVCNVWGYCLGSPFYAGKLPEGLMHPRRIRDGVHHGVIDGGNQSGIPWARGFERFDERYLGKPLVYCGTVGRIPRALQGRPSERKEIRPGDAIVMCGGRIGKDGIHGATFSSEELRKESPAQAVQIGDPITQRKLYEFLMEARDRGLFRAITDNGAGGLSSSIGEMCQLSGGADLDLARAPLKYAGLQPWEIFLSEAQERMSLAVQPENVAALLALAARRDVEAAVLGQFTGSGALILRHAGRVVARIGLDFLHDGCPRLEIPARWAPPRLAAPRRTRRSDYTPLLRELLADLNLCSKEYKSRMYDGEVKGLSVVKPFVGAHSDMPSDATVLRVTHGNRRGIVLAEGINPFYSDLDTYAMMASVIDEAVRRVISAGGRLDRIAGLDNFCWPDPVLSDKTPDGPYKMAQLVRANQALYDLTTAYKVPAISGKDSMKNDSVRGGKKISIPPTVLFSTLGQIDDVRKAVTMNFKKAGDLIYVAGLTRDELGASAYFRRLAAKQNAPQKVGGRVPTVEPAAALALYRAMNKAAAAGVLQSSHTPTQGGLSVAFALAALGGDLGAHMDLADVPAEAGLAMDARLFSESNSRFVLTCRPADAKRLEKIFKGLPCARVGEVRKDRRLVVSCDGRRACIDARLDDLRKGFKKTLLGV